MDSLYRASFSTDFGSKSIEVYCCDVTLFDEDIDILTTSAFEGSYYPTPRTVFNALHNIGISVYDLAQKPFMDLRPALSQRFRFDIGSTPVYPHKTQSIGIYQLFLQG